MSTEDSFIVKLELDVDIGAKSNMFCCMICFDLIQRPAEHRQCSACGNTICTGCVARLTKPNSCPSCRANVEFISNSLIHKTIYPKVSRACANAECKQILFNVGAHELVCKYRSVDCPVCHHSVRLLTIHDHLARDCALPYKYPKGCGSWDTVLRCNWSEFERELRGVGKLPYAPYFQTFDLNPTGFKQTALTTRVLYFWRKGSRECSYINMMCIQLSASSDESIGYATTASGGVRSMTIASIGNFEDVMTSVETGDRISTYKIELDAGIHLLAYGDTYEIKHEILDEFTMMAFARFVGRHSSWIGNLIEILHTPDGVSRAVFVDRYGDTKTVEMNAAFMQRVKKVAAPNVGVRDEHDFPYRNDGTRIRIGDTFPGRRLSSGRVDASGSSVQRPAPDEPGRDPRGRFPGSFVVFPSRIDEQSSNRALVSPDTMHSATDGGLRIGEMEDNGVIRDSYPRSPVGVAQLRRIVARQSSERIDARSASSGMNHAPTASEWIRDFISRDMSPFSPEFDGDEPDASPTRPLGIPTTSRVGEMASSNMSTVYQPHRNALNMLAQSSNQEDATLAAYNSILLDGPTSASSDDSDDELPMLESSLNDEYPEPRVEHRISDEKMRSMLTGAPIYIRDLREPNLDWIRRSRNDIFATGRHEIAGLIASAFTSAMIAQRARNNPDSRISNPRTDTHLFSELFTAMLSHNNNPPASEPTERADELD
jgi:hypothetical protein